MRECPPVVMLNASMRGRGRLEKGSIEDAMESCARSLLRRQRKKARMVRPKPTMPMRLPTMAKMAWLEDEPEVSSASPSELEELEEAEGGEEVAEAEMEAVDPDGV